jgi:hypothetical protein
MVPAGERRATPTGDGFATDYPIGPLSKCDWVVHALGASLNAVVTLIALAFLVRNGSALAAHWPFALLGLAAGTFVADLVSGLLHWAFDTWFHEDLPLVRRMVLLVREHHTHPDRIFRYHFWQDAGMLSWFALLSSGPFVWFAVEPAGVPGGPRCLWALMAVTMSVEVVFMFEFHKCGHRVQRSDFVRMLQRFHLLLSPDHHLRHHSGRHDRNYCLITGIADQTVGRLGAFRALERVVSAVTGAVPRENDRAWRRRFGRCAL